jgi:hypothetical protein
LGLNFGLKTLSSLKFSLVPPSTEMLVQYHRKHHNCFLPHPYKLIIHDHCHLMPYNLCSWINQGSDSLERWLKSCEGLPSTNELRSNLTQNCLDSLGVSELQHPL